MMTSKLKVTHKTQSKNKTQITFQNTKLTHAQSLDQEQNQHMYKF